MFEISGFLPLESIDPIRIGEGYYLAPDGQVAAKPYKLLVKALGRSSKVAVARYAWSGRERLGLVRVRGDVLVLHAMRWPDEIRSPQELLPPPVEVTDEEIEGAVALMESMSRDDLEGAEFRDTCTDALAEDVPVGERVIPAGDALIVSYGALGRDEEAHGPSAGEFDITRETKSRHISFGHGPHVCPGAALSRLEAGVALPALYARFPHLDLAVPAAELRHKPVVTQNDLFELPVRVNG